MSNMTIYSFLAIGILSMPITALAQEKHHHEMSAADSVMQHTQGKGLSVGGYGEINYSRNFYAIRSPRSTRTTRRTDGSTFPMPSST